MRKKIAERKMVTPQMAAEIYGLDVGTLANLRYLKRGPQFYRCGKKKILYRIEELEAWLLRNPVLTTDSINQTN
jgi:hypothetical protein